MSKFLCIFFVVIEKINHFLFHSVEASEADKSVFAALTEGPSAEAYPHLARWYAHIAAVQGLITK